VSYNGKHNEANGEENRDGDNNNNSWNCGCEGPTDDPAIHKLRETKMRSILATLLLSQGVPMLQAGDEIGRTQNGNNNAYCQDNDITWLRWEPDERKAALLKFVPEWCGCFTSSRCFTASFHGQVISWPMVAGISWRPSAMNDDCVEGGGETRLLVKHPHHSADELQQGRLSLVRLPASQVMSLSWQ